MAYDEKHKLHPGNRQGWFRGGGLGCFLRSVSLCMRWPGCNFFSCPSASVLEVNMKLKQPLWGQTPVLWIQGVVCSVCSAGFWKLQLPALSVTGSSSSGDAPGILRPFIARVFSWSYCVCVCVCMCVCVFCELFVLCFCCFTLQEFCCLQQFWKQSTQLSCPCPRPL